MKQFLIHFQGIIPVKWFRQLHVFITQWIIFIIHHLAYKMASNEQIVLYNYFPYSSFETWHFPGANDVANNFLSDIL